MCTCFDDIKKKTEEKIRKANPNVTEIEVLWKNEMFFLGEDVPKISITIPLEYSYRNVKKSGKPYTNKTRGETNAVMSYCPICGEKQ